MGINYKNHLLEIIPSLDEELLEDVNKIFNKNKVMYLKILKSRYVRSLNNTEHYDTFMYNPERRNLKKKQIKNLDRLINLFQYLQKCELNKQ